MNDQDILQQSGSINTWQRRGTKTPNKPLLMLMAPGEIQRGQLRLYPLFRP